MYQINEKVVFVKGAKHGAIYNLNDGRVFSINSESCNVLRKIIDGSELTDEELGYEKTLEESKLICLEKFEICEYFPPTFSNRMQLVWLEITQACNCKCVHCYEGNNHSATNRQLTLEQWFCCINQIAALNVARVVIIGGEPCIHKDITKIVQFAVDKGLDVTIFTNGTIISNELKSVIVKNNLKLKLSIYGHTAQIHDAITQIPGSFDKLMDNITYFKEKNIKINLSVVIMRENQEYYDEIKKILDSLNINGYKFDVIREVFNGNQNLHVPDNKRIIKSVMRTTARFSPISEERFSNAYYHNTCWNGKIVISEDGNVLPCVFERGISLGNINKESIETIINSDATKKCWDCTFDGVDECKKCEFRFACKDCRPLAAVNGEKTAKNPRCTYDVYRGEWL
ncbi:MAG: radical SAM protein [Bacilli bacterium]